MIANGGGVIHSLGDRCSRAKIATLSDDELSIAVVSDSINSAKKNCSNGKVYGPKRIQISAVAYIMRHYPEQVLFNACDLKEIVRIQIAICYLPDVIRSEVVAKLWENLKKKQLRKPAQSSRGNAEKTEAGQ